MNMQKIHLSRKRIFRFIAAAFLPFPAGGSFPFRSTEAGSVAASARALLAHGGVAGVITGVITIAVLTGLVLSTALLFLPNATRFTGRFCAHVYALRTGRRFRCCFYCCAGWALALPLG